jgi:hypothetical protein
MGLLGNISNYYTKLHIYPKIFVTAGLLIAFVLCIYIAIAILTDPSETRQDLKTDAVILPFVLGVVGFIIFLPFLLSAALVSIEKCRRSAFILFLSVLGAILLFKIYFVIFIYSSAARLTGAFGFFVLIPLCENSCVMASWGIHKGITFVSSKRKGK